MDYRPAMQAAPTGIGRYTAALAAELARDEAGGLRLFGVFRRGNRPAVRRAPAGARLLAWPIPSRGMNLLGDLGLLPADRALGGCDVFHHTNYLMASVSARTPQVMTVHDLAFLRDPACHTPRAAHAMERVVRASARRCAAFLVPSEATADDCEALLGFPRDRVFVTPLGVDASFFDLPAPPPTRPYLLAVGTLEPRKNYPRLVRAFRRAGVADLELRIVGLRGWLADDVREGPGVRLLGHVGEPELRRLLAGAAAFCYPSLLEGFGLPVLEAMAAGVPVLTSDREPLRTLAGDAALLVDPTDEEALADGIRTILHDQALRRRLRVAGPRRARAFTWAACAAATRRAFATVAGA